MKSCRRRSSLAFAAVAAFAVTFAGCESNGARGGGTANAPMTASGELATPNPKPMDAQGSFFAGQIEAEAMLGKSDAAWRNPAPAEGGRGSGGGFSGGSGGAGRRGGGGGRGMSAGHRGGSEGGAPPQTTGTEPARGRGPAMRASNAPPVQLRLRLINHGAEPVEVEVLDFNSDLGNFVVQPGKMTLPPGEPVDAEPMTSRLGVPAVDAIPITVRLRVGGKNGKTEQQILELLPRAEAPVADEQKMSEAKP